MALLVAAVMAALIVYTITLGPPDNPNTRPAKS